MDFNAKRISSIHLASPALLCYEFHPVVLPWGSVISGLFITNSVEPYSAFPQQFQEITGYLFTFDST